MVDDGPWSEDLYPGALSSSARKRIIAMHEHDSDTGHALVYVIRNDALLDMLAHHNGRTYHWNKWAPRCSRVFELKVKKIRDM